AGLAAFPVGAWILPALGLTPSRVPLSVLASGWVLGILVAAGPRWAIRMYAPTTGRPQRRRGDRRRAARRNALIIGAGHAGEMVARELRRSSHLDLELVGFLDDDPEKQRRVLGGLPVLGRLDQLAGIVARYHVAKVIIAMPTAPGPVIRGVLEQARNTGAQVRTVPGLFEIISGRKAVSALREIEIADLLRREPVETDLAAVSQLVGDRTVLVTGAGGSIGSELCRQLCEMAPRRLLLLGHGENSIFGIHNELFARVHDVELVPLIADIRDREALRRLMDRHRPDAIFHAAAHKHVPLMEHNIHEAVMNNVMGTRHLAETAAEFGVENLLLISSDKAVRPTNVMGATKRVAEQLIQDLAITTGRRYVAVRFGNVLGSRGSVVPTFLKQIAEGGPVTVTHPEMRRYFMTIPEAVQLVLQAAAIGQGGEVFVLDMGQPVKIADLATDLIRLAGLQPGRDVEIRFTGIRPGEKLYEELFFSDETASPTVHPKILRARNAAPVDQLHHRAAALVEAALAGADDTAMRTLLREVVPDYSPTEPLDGGPTDAAPAATAWTEPAADAPVGRNDVPPIRPSGPAGPDPTSGT
ncbi:MAG TPA: nucleoside-diphosphate sugar epimerase/dehydratase, partial [Gemmatimonadales bacterium]|nr:nucleoside-diphosphate sugar epimerase/dehydratase [Gemmatimonadales bacterium]